MSYKLTNIPSADRLIDKVSRFLIASTIIVSTKFDFQTLTTEVTFFHLGLSPGPCIKTRLFILKNITYILKRTTQFKVKSKPNYGLKLPF